LTAAHLVKNSPSLQGIWRVTTVFTSCLTLDLLLSQLNSVSTLTEHLFKIHFNITLPQAPWVSEMVFSLQTFQPNNLDTFFIPPMFITCTVDLNFLELFVLILFGKEYKLWSSPMHSSQPRAIFPASGSNTVLTNWHQTCSTSQHMFFPSAGKFIFLYILIFRYFRQ
jgi:hypothetical protein